MKNSNAIIKTLLILGVIYCLLAYWLPVREYRRVTDRFNQYIAETFMSESNSNGTYLVARLEMSPDEFCSLKEELVAQDWTADDTTDFYSTITLIEDKEPGDKTESLFYSTHVPVPPEIFDNKITIEMYVVHKHDKVLIEYRGYVWVSHIPFEKLR